MQKIATPVIFVSAVAATLFYVSQEEHDTGTLCLLAAVLLVGQICATLPFILEAKRPKQTGTHSNDADGNGQKIIANQQIIHEDLRSLGETLIKRLTTLAERREATEKKLLSAFPKNDSHRTEDLEELLGKIRQNLDERFENLSGKIDEIETSAPNEAVLKKLDLIDARLEDFLAALENLSAENAEYAEDEDTGTTNEEDDAFTDFDDIEDDETEENEADIDAFPEDSSDAPESATQGEFELGDLPRAVDATLVLEAMLGIGNKPFLRGNAPDLSETAGTPMTFVEIGKWSHDFKALTEEVSVRILLNDDENAPLGEKITLAPGQKLELAYVPDRK